MIKVAEEFNLSLYVGCSVLLMVTNQDTHTCSKQLYSLHVHNYSYRTIADRYIYGVISDICSLSLSCHL